MYNGGRSTPAALQGVIEESDLLIDLGGLVMDDLITGLWSGRLDVSRLVALHSDWVQAGDQVFTSVSLSDVLEGLITRFKTGAKQPSRWGNERFVQPDSLLPLAGEVHEPTSSSGFYPRLQRFLRPTDLLVSDTGTCLLKLMRFVCPLA